jgi:hypothetical protein
MVTNVYPVVAEESCVTNPQKVAEIDKKNQKNGKRWVCNTAFANDFPDSSVLKVKSNW